MRPKLFAPGLGSWLLGTGKEVVQMSRCNCWRGAHAIPLLSIWDLELPQGPRGPVRGHETLDLLVSVGYN